MTAAPTISTTNVVLVPVMPDKFACGWPEHEHGDKAQYRTVHEAICLRYSTDAHFAAYSVPEIDRRLATPDVFAKLPDGIPMVLFVVDVEPEGHAPVTTEWWEVEHAKFKALRARHAGALLYRTRGGYRIVYVLEVPFVLRSTEDAERWKRTYLAWLEYLATTFSIVGDPSCQDWTRLYRLPRVRRDGKPQDLAIYGALDGTWNVDVTIPEPEPRDSQPRESAYTPTADDFDIRAALASSGLNPKHTKTPTADRYTFECPWQSEHKTKSGRKTCVMVYPTGAWEFICLGGTCHGIRNHEDFRQWLDPTWKPYDPNAPKRTKREPAAEPDDEPPIDEAYAPTVELGENDDFARDPKTKQIYVTQANVMLALRKLGVSVSFDEFARHELIRGLPGHGPRIDDAALLELRLLVDERFSFRIAKEWFVDVVTRHAWRNRFHPVRDYLDGLKWDGTPRIDRWLIDLAGAPDTSYVLAVSRLVLVAAVRRIRQPGCKFDEMVILESKQGTNKSTALGDLAVRPEWFADDLPLDGDTKHLIEQTSGKWIVEAGELKGMSKGDVAKLKACLSRQVDEARLSYGRKNTIAPRQFVIIGTTNEKHGYLKDTTGNRRFWPVRIDAFDLEKLHKVRDQLWAEAAYYEVQGESIRLDPALWGDAAAEQAEREMDDDPIEVALGEALGNRSGKIRALDIWEILNVEPGKATQDQNARMGAAMRRLGWERAKRRFGSGAENAYVKGTADQREVTIDVDVTAVHGQRMVNVSGGAP